MDMGLAAEVGYHVRTFDLPYVPDIIVADVLAFVEGEVEVVDSAGFDVFHRFLSIGFAERSEHVAQDFAKVVFLIVC